VEISNTLSWDGLTEMSSGAAEKQQACLSKTLICVPYEWSWQWIRKSPRYWRVDESQYNRCSGACQMLYPMGVLGCDRCRRVQETRIQRWPTRQFSSVVPDSYYLENGDLSAQEQLLMVIEHVWHDFLDICTCICFQMAIPSILNSCALGLNVHDLLSECHCRFY